MAAFEPHTPAAEGVRNEAAAPGAIAATAEDKGVEKAHYDAGTLLLLALLGGAFIAIGGMFSTVVMAGSEHQAFGLTRLLAGSVFSLGLVLILAGGGQLFTGDCLMVMAWASGRLNRREMGRVWVVVWLGNFAGALGVAALVVLSGHYKYGHGAVGAAALYLAQAKSNLPFGEAFFAGIMCNVLVCLAVWLSYGARSMTDRILAIAFPVAAFVAAGFEHCVANMYFIPLGLLIKRFAPDSFWSEIGRDAASVAIPVDGFLANLAAVTAGNWVGGAILVGAVYWLIYRRPALAAARAAHPAE